MDRISLLASGAFHALPALLAVAPLYLLGVVCAWLSGVRGRTLPLVTAVPLLIGGTALVAEFCHFVGLEVSPLRLLAGLLAVAVVTFGVRRLLALRRLPAHGDDGVIGVRQGSGWVALGGTGGAILGVGAWLAGIAGAGTPPQANDDIFHGYLVTRLSEATEISAQTMAPAFVGESAPVSFYPYGMHLFMSMAEALTPAGVPASMNGTWVLLVGALLPLASAAAAREMFPARPRTALWAGLLAPAITVPYMLNGIMSYVMTLAIVPAAMLLVLRRWRAPADVPGPVLAIVLTSLFISHPAAALTAALVVGCVGLDVMVSDRSAARSALQQLGPPFLGSGILVLPWYLAAGSAGVTGGGAPVNQQMSGLAAVSTAMRLETPWAPAQLLLAVLVVLGAVAAVRWRAGRGLLFAYAAFLVAYASILAGFAPVARWTGLWYGQWYRIAGVVAVLVPFLAALGVELLGGLWRRGSSESRPVLVRRAAAGALAVCVGVAGLSMARYLVRGEGIVSSAWGLSTVTEEDRAFFGEVAKTVPADQQVLNYWPDGSTWIYALSHVTPAIPYDSTVQRDEWADATFNNETSIQTQPTLCQGLLDRNVRFAIAKNSLNDGSPSSFAADLAANPTLFRELSRSTTTVLYAIRPAVLETCAQRG